MSSEVALVTASTKLSIFLGMEKGMMIETLKAQCFKGKRPDEVTDAQLASFVSVASVLELNPLVPGMLYAYPERNGGITPIVGPDGTFKKLDEQIAAGKIIGYECEVYPADVAVLPTHAVCTIERPGDGKPARYTAIFREWNVSNNPNWQTRPRHMLWLRAIKQCARQVIHGLPMDEDERRIAEMQNVTGTGEPEAEAPKTERPPPKKREQRGVAAVAENPPAESTKATEPAIEVPATPVAETPANPPAPFAPVEVVQPAAEAPKADPKPVAPANNAPVVLEDGKEITVEGIAVERFVEKDINKVAKSIQAEVSGPYVGTVYHLGGACPAWQIEKPVTLRLLGKKLKSGAIAGMVQSIEITAASAGGETIE